MDYDVNTRLRYQVPIIGYRDKRQLDATPFGNDSFFLDDRRQTKSILNKVDLDLRRADDEHDDQMLHCLGRNNGIVLIDYNAGQKNSDPLITFNFINASHTACLKQDVLPNASDVERTSRFPRNEHYIQKAQGRPILHIGLHESIIDTLPPGKSNKVYEQSLQALFDFLHHDVSSLDDVASDPSVQTVDVLPSTAVTMASAPEVVTSIQSQAETLQAPEQTEQATQIESSSQAEDKAVPDTTLATTESTLPVVNADKPRKIKKSRTVYAETAQLASQAMLGDHRYNVSAYLDAYETQKSVLHEAYPATPPIDDVLESIEPTDPLSIFLKSTDDDSFLRMTREVRAAKPRDFVLGQF